jgi:putative Flp pilus-assembly TadE/G-like protein/von Willebrand factor type A domain-containing protein
VSLHGQTMRRDDGQSLVIVVIFLALLLGFCALTLDVGHAYLAQRRLQSSVDAAALAGAQALPNALNAANLAGQYGNGGANTPRDVDGVSMTVATKCLASAPGCSPVNAVVVKESGSVQTVFGKIFGVSQLNVHAQATACSPCGARPLDIMLVLDRTGSMCTDSAGRPDPTCADMANARNGMETFLKLMAPNLDHVGLAVLPPATSVANRCEKPSNATATNYDNPNSPYVVVPLSDDYLTGSDLNGSSDLVSTIECVQANGYTAYADAIDAAQATLAATGRPGVQKVVVLLSDGAANTGPLTYPASSPYLKQPCHQGITSSQAATAAGTVVFSIGYDLGHDRCQGEDKATQNRTDEVPAITAMQALQGIASVPGDFYNQPDAAQLNGIFTSIAADLLAGTSRLVDDNAS